MHHYLIYFNQRTSLGELTLHCKQQFLDHRNYLGCVVHRVVAAIAFISERGLDFRGTDKTVGCRNIGNYLGELELIANIDQSLVQHINEHANQGRGHTSYLSKIACEEFTEVMSKKVMSPIVAEIISAQYFSVSVDSTRDVTHADQLTIIVRYASSTDYTPVERFLTFVEIISHTGANLAKILLDFLTKYGVNIVHCRRQSYDNASNMTGKYTEMQAKIKESSAHAKCILCAAHSLNLIRQSAVDCCVEAVTFFGVLQNLYVLFLGINKTLEFNEHGIDRQLQSC